MSFFIVYFIAEVIRDDSKQLIFEDVAIFLAKRKDLLSHKIQRKFSMTKDVMTITDVLKRTK
jgi:hypothetical protein